MATAAVQPCTLSIKYSGSTTLHEGSPVALVAQPCKGKRKASCWEAEGYEGRSKELKEGGVAKKSKGDDAKVVILAGTLFPDRANDFQPVAVHVSGVVDVFNSNMATTAPISHVVHDPAVTDLGYQNNVHVGTFIDGQRIVLGHSESTDTGGEEQLPPFTYAAIAKKIGQVAKLGTDKLKEALDKAKDKADLIFNKIEQSLGPERAGNLADMAFKIALATVLFYAGFNEEVPDEIPPEDAETIVKNARKYNFTSSGTENRSNYTAENLSDYINTTKGKSTLNITLDPVDTEPELNTLLSKSKVSFTGFDKPVDVPTTETFKTIIRKLDRTEAVKASLESAKNEEEVLNILKGVLNDQFGITRQALDELPLRSLETLAGDHAKASMKLENKFISQPDGNVSVAQVLRYLPTHDFNFVRKQIKDHLKAEIKRASESGSNVDIFNNNGAKVKVSNFSNFEEIKKSSVESKATTSSKPKKSAKKGAAETEESLGVKKADTKKGDSTTVETETKKKIIEKTKQFVEEIVRDYGAFRKSFESDSAEVGDEVNVEVLDLKDIVNMPSVKADLQDIQSVTYDAVKTMSDAAATETLNSVGRGYTTIHTAVKSAIETAFDLKGCVTDDNLGLFLKMRPENYIALIQSNGVKTTFPAQCIANVQSENLEKKNSPEKRQSFIHFMEDAITMSKERGETPCLEVCEVGDEPQNAQPALVLMRNPQTIKSQKVIGSDRNYLTPPKVIQIDKTLVSLIYKDKLALETFIRSLNDEDQAALLTLVNDNLEAQGKPKVNYNWNVGPFYLAKAISESTNDGSNRAFLLSTLNKDDPKVNVYVVDKPAVGNIVQGTNDVNLPYNWVNYLASTNTPYSEVSALGYGGLGLLLL